MSYPRSLDEYTARELEDRERAKRQGLCDYCHRPPESPACRFPERHRGEE